LGRFPSYAVVASCSFGHSLEGKNIREINPLKKRKKKLRDEIQTILDLMAQGGADTVYHSMGEQDVERILRHPNTAVGSDGGIREFGVGVPHPRSYGTNARVLAEFVRNRGLVREGYAADLVLVNGQPVVDNGKLTGTRSGRVLRHAANP
jgi:N-acyl-D-amino-acid deacylase